MALPAMPLSFAKQPLYAVIWTIWEQVLLIGALPTIVWIIDASVRRRKPSGEPCDPNMAPWLTDRLPTWDRRRSSNGAVASRGYRSPSPVAPCRSLRRCRRNRRVDGGLIA